MGAVSYKKLFQVEMLHTYYENGITKDFGIVPTEETQAILKNNNLLFKVDSTGFRVLYRNEEGSDNAFIPFSNLKLRFELILKNVFEFENITDLKQNGPMKNFVAGNLAEFSNMNNPLNSGLKYKIIDAVKPSLFTYEFPQVVPNPTTETGRIVIKNEAGDNVTPASPDPDNILPTEEGKFFYPIDFKSMPVGTYNFRTIVTGVPNQRRNLFIGDALARKNVFGIVEINVENEQASSFPADRMYRARFKKREPNWRYLILIQSSIVDLSDDLEIIDAQGTYSFSRKTDTDFNGIPTAVFDSDTPIPLTQLPVQELQFVKRNNPSNVDVIVGNLSNPVINVVSADGNDFNTSQIYVYV